jgi:hypothetical protein
MLLVVSVDEEVAAAIERASERAGGLGFDHGRCHMIS